MDAVNAFNVELFSMNDMVPPISRAKMMSVTKAAIKAIKLYKHVVQIVERFIRKCKPELKVSGLYVVDSIIRQSRHQFGLDKDVFGPRFLKNFTDTFQNLYLCPEDDKSKVVRVLNLWQKNGVFDMDILQPLMDMANKVIVPPPAVKVPTAPQPETELPVTTASVVPVESQLPNFDALAAVAQLFQSPHGHELQRILQNLQQANNTLSATDSDNIPNSPQMHVAQLNPYSAQLERKSSFAEKLLDRFDYDDEPEDVTAKEGNLQPQGIPENVFPGQVTNIDSLHMMAQTVGIEQVVGMSHGEPQMLDRYHPINEASLQFQRGAREDSTVNCEGRHGIYSRRSRSDSRSPRRRRSRSLSRTRRYRHQRSRSGERHWRSRSRSRSRDRNERQRDRDRRQKGLPSKKSHALSVCSTTLWIGQLDKKTQQCDVMCLLEEFGQIESINMIPPRGCAYIAMVHRQDAYTALNKLSSGPYRVNQKPVKIAWALNRGIKTAHKKFWNVEQGVTYIPWSKVKIEDLESYREGGMLDEETLNPEWNIKDLSKQAVANGKLEIVPVDGAAPAHIQVPHVEQTLPIGSPLPFPGPVVLSPTSMPPGGAPFFHAENMHTNAAGIESPPEDANTDSEVHLSHSTFSDNQLRPLAPPVITMPEPGVFHGPRPGFPPLHPQAGMTSPHIPQFPPSANMPHLPPQVPRGPMFTRDRFRMPLPFPPRDPPFHRYPSTGPEDMDVIERRHFQSRNPEFARPPFQRGRW